MRHTLMLVIALAAILHPVPASAQSLASRVGAVRDGAVRLSVPTHAAICGNGRFIGEETRRGFATYTVWNDGYSVQTYEFFQPDCQRGPLRLVVIKEHGRVTGLRAAIAVEWRSGLESPDLGMVDAGEAAAWLLDVATAVHEDVGIVAFLAANATDAPIANRLIRMSTDRSLRDTVRERAIRWVNGAAEREGKIAEADFALRTVAMTDADSPDVRERAIRSLRASPSNDAFLAEIYRRLDRHELKDRIIRRLAAHPTDQTVEWLRGIVLDPAEPDQARDRALRLLGSELKRFDVVRGLYGRLDHAGLTDRALRVAAEEGGDATYRWLEAVVENPSERAAARDRALRLLSGKTVLDMPALYARIDNHQLKDRLLRLAGERGDSATIVWLRDVAVNVREPTELRDRALRTLAAHAVQTVELATLYDRVGRNELKQRVIRLLAERRDEPAIDKLISIAESETSSDLRRYAMRRLADTGHPKARAYLEETVRRP